MSLCSHEASVETEGSTSSKATSLLTFTPNYTDRYPINFNRQLDSLQSPKKGVSVAG